MVLEQVRSPLVPRLRPLPEPAAGQLVVRVLACAVCRTDLHVVDGELARCKLPVLPGHEIVGAVHAVGAGVTGISLGERVGIPWLGFSCGTCAFCVGGKENLCDQARFTGCDLDGGFAEFAVADARFCFALPATYTDAEAAPLLCAGLIGHRTLSFAGEAQRVGIYGFGAAAHLLAQVARAQGRDVYAFTRPGDEQAQRFAREVGAVWAAASGSAPPVELDAALIFAPVGALIPEALRAVRKGGVVVCGGIHMSDVPSFPYALLWGERTVRSVANLTRQDAADFFAIAAREKLSVSTTVYPLEDANRALTDLRSGSISGAAVLVP